MYRPPPLPPHLHLCLRNHHRLLRYACSRLLGRLCDFFVVIEKAGLLLVSLEPTRFWQYLNEDCPR